MVLAEAKVPVTYLEGGPEGGGPPKIFRPPRGLLFFWGPTTGNFFSARFKKAPRGPVPNGWGLVGPEKAIWGGDPGRAKGGRGGG